MQNWGEQSWEGRGWHDERSWRSDQQGGSGQQGDGGYQGQQGDSGQQGQQDGSGQQGGNWGQQGGSVQLWPAQPQTPPDAVMLQQARATGWHAGHSAGHTAGFKEGYQNGFVDGAKNRPEPTAEPDQSTNKRRNKKKGEGWRAWGETYTTFDEDTAMEPYFFTRTGKAKTVVYPVEIQKNSAKHGPPWMVGGDPGTSCTT